MSTYFNSDKSLKNEQNSKAALVIAALAGVVGNAADGIGISAFGADLLPQLAALAVPGLVAWVLSYLVFKKPDVSVPLLPEVGGEFAQLLTEKADIPSSVPAPLPENTASAT